MLPIEGSRDKPVVVFLETAFLDYFSSLNKVIKLIQRFSKRFNEKLISRKKIKKEMAAHKYKILSICSWCMTQCWIYAPG